MIACLPADGSCPGRRWQVAAAGRVAGGNLEKVMIPF